MDGAPETWPEGAMALLQGLQAPRPLDRWLHDLAGALQACGLWSVLSHDSAGQSLLRALRLSPGAGQELVALVQQVKVITEVEILPLQIMVAVVVAELAQ
jgi:hypothetical protein